LVLSGVLSAGWSAPARAQATTIEITDVYNSVNAGDEWFQLYNMTKASITLQGWNVCSSSTCVPLPTMTIDSFNLAKIKNSSLAGWPATGFDGANDMLGLKDDAGHPVDTLNWGTPSPSWKNYATFKDMLWTPGIKAPDASANQSFFRMAIGKDTDQPTDWLTTASKVQGAPPPAAAPTTAPAAAATPVATAPPIQTNTQPNTQPTPQPQKNPQTGGEFPAFLALGLIVAVFLIRYFRRGLVPQSRLR